MKQGRLIGLSLGPGDPGWITRKAWEYLQADGVWTYPVRKRGAESYALGIVERAGLPRPSQHQPLVFPMTQDAQKLAQAWVAAAQEVVQILQGGEDVFFLVEGDASTYSTFVHLYRAVQALEPGIQVETVPGVSSFNAAAAQVNAPLAMEGDCMAVVPAGYGVDLIRHMIEEFDHLVLLKVKPMLDEILDLLEELGLTQEARFIEKVGSPEERIIEDVSRLRGEKVNYLSLMLVNHPGRIKGEMVRGCKKQK